MKQLKVEELEIYGYDIEEERNLLNFLKDLGWNWTLAPIEDPERIGMIIAETRNNMQKYENYLYKKYKRPELLPRCRERITERLHLVSIAKTIPLFRRYDPTDLTINNLPPQGERVADTEMVELIVANLYVSSSLYNDLLFTPPLERRAKLKNFKNVFLNIVNSYEKSLKANNNGIGKYRKDAAGRAMFAYAYESLVHPRFFDCISSDPDLTNIYGKEGFMYEVKKKYVFPKRNLIAELNEEFIRKRGEKMEKEGKKYIPTSCWAHQIRQLFIGFVPEFKVPSYLA
jgi:hypothetical protein